MKHLSDPCWVESGYNGYVVSVGIFAENISDNIISDMNHLSQLSEIHVQTANYHTGNENVTNLSLLNKLNRINTLFLHVGEQSAIPYLELPESVNTIVISGENLDDNDLNYLTKFTHIKKIYIETQNNSISAEEITTFKKKRPDVLLEF
ncbi:MAG: hypothetical protein LBP87_10435 [Planctomycetaceae bacterium]|jgi:hypothetical protein|nr:hypothetical protein [Planctomycetaceae bacterium]